MRLMRLRQRDAVYGPPGLPVRYRDGEPGRRMSRLFLSPLGLEHYSPGCVNSRIRARRLGSTDPLRRRTRLELR
jgi:hypothetical protein